VPRTRAARVGEYRDEHARARKVSSVTVLAYPRRHGVAAPRHLFNNGEVRSPYSTPRPQPLPTARNRSHLSTDGGRSRTGGVRARQRRPAVSPHQQPSDRHVAKVMTAYVVLKHDPLRVDDSGRRSWWSGHVVDTETRRREGRRLSMSAPVSSSPSAMPYGDPVAVRTTSRLVALRSRQRRLLRAEMNDTAPRWDSHTTSPIQADTTTARSRQPRSAASGAGVAKTRRGAMMHPHYWLPVAVSDQHQHPLGQDDSSA